MKLAVAADHAGYELKQHMVEYLQEQGHEVLDLGTNSAEHRTDYPVAAQSLGNAVVNGDAERGILICGSGVGACIAANKIKGVYAAICHDTYSAGQGVEHDNMNVLCLGGLVVGAKTAETLADAFVHAKFNGIGRYEKRFEMVQQMESTSE